MSSWVATMVETKGRPDFWDVAREHQVTQFADSVPAVALIDCDTGLDFEASTRLARALSSELETTAFGLLVQTSVDVYGIRAFENSTELRWIDYSRDGGRWLRIDGAPRLGSPSSSSMGRRISHPVRIGRTRSTTTSPMRIAEYEAARAKGDPTAILPFVHASRGSVRVARNLGVDPEVPHGRWKKPAFFPRLFGR